MSASQGFELPELPPVCLSCGCRGPLTAQKVEYKYTSAGALSALAFLVGILYYREMTYTLQLPLCAGCRGHRRRKRWVLLLMWPGVFGLLMLAINYTFDVPELYALPVIFLFACMAYAYVLQGKGQPKVARIDNALLVVRVPGYGEVTLFDRLGVTRTQPQWRAQEAGPEPAQASRPRTSPRPAARRTDGPQLNRSVCEECGFINFASAAECKKCRAPLGAGAVSAA